MINFAFRLMLLLVVYMSILIYPNSAGAETFESRGVKIYYTDSNGTGEPVILVHGYTQDSTMWHDIGVVQKLSKEHRVVALDLRGHGKSGKPENVDEYGPKVGNDIVNLLEHLKIAKAHMVGYSMGAFVIGRILVTNPDRIISATLGSGFFPTLDNDEQVFQEHTALEMEKNGQPALAAVARGWRYDAVTDKQISKITVPVQAIFGSKEIDDFFESQKKRLEMPKSALPIVIIEGADHDSNRAAVLHPKFMSVVENLINSNKVQL